MRMEKALSHNGEGLVYFLFRESRSLVRCPDRILRAVCHGTGIRPGL